MQRGGGIPRCRGGGGSRGAGRGGGSRGVGGDLNTTQIPQHYTDVSRRGCFGGRPSDILNPLGLDNPISGGQLGLILEALRSWLATFVCVPDESDEGGLILISCF